MNNAKRRTKGTGNIRQRSAGSWSLRYEGPPDANGRLKKVHETVKGTRRDAERALRDRLSAVEKGSFVEKSKETVAEFLWRWMDTYAVDTELRTQQGYRTNIRRVASMIGSIQLQGLQPRHIQKMYAELRKRPLKPQTILHTHRVLREALSHAVKWGVLNRNPSDSVDPPRPQKNTMEMWDTDVIQEFLSAAQGSRFRDVYHLAVLTGMRRSELAGLRWEYVDIDAAKLSVVTTLQRITGMGLVQGQPKRGRSKRMIALSPGAVRLLQRVRKTRIENRLRAGPAWQDTGYVFTQEDGTPFDADRLTTGFALIVRAAELPHLTLHGLRHAHATMLLKAGVHPKVVSERLGHSNIAITMDVYSHVLPGLQEAAALIIDESLAGEL